MILGPTLLSEKLSKVVMFRSSLFGRPKGLAMLVLPFCPLSPLLHSTSPFSFFSVILHAASRCLRFPHYLGPLDLDCYAPFAHIMFRSSLFGRPRACPTKLGGGLTMLVLPFCPLSPLLHSTSPFSYLL